MTCIVLLLLLIQRVPAGIFIGFVEIEMYKLEESEDVTVYGPITVQPNNPFAVAELDSASGDLKWSEAKGPLTCNSLGGSLGNEEIQCAAGDEEKPIIRRYLEVKSLTAPTSQRRRSLYSSDAADRSKFTNGTEVISLSRTLTNLDFSDANTFTCISNPINLGDTDSVVLNYTICQIDTNEISVSGDTILVGSSAVISHSNLDKAKIVLPTPGQDFLVTKFTDCSADVELDGFSNVFVQANLVQQGCGIRVDGTATSAIMEIDFGSESNADCDDGFEVTIERTTVTIVRANVPIMEIKYGASFRDILVRMSNCDDVVNVVSTHHNASSVEIWGAGGNDNITIGTENQPFEESIYANIVVHGSKGASDRLIIHDEASTRDKIELLRPMQITGLHQNPKNLIDYDGFEFLDIFLSNGTNELTVACTETKSETSITSGDNVDTVIVNCTDGLLNLNTAGGADSITVREASADFFIYSGEGDDTINLFALKNNSTGTIYGEEDNDTLNIDGRGLDDEILLNQFDGTSLRWSGGIGDDTVNTYFTSTGISFLEIFDDLNRGDVNQLNVDCANFACYLLSREYFLANIHDINNSNSTVERINIGRNEGTPTATISSIVLRMNG